MGAGSMVEILPSSPPGVQYFCAASTPGGTQELGRRPPQRLTPSQDLLKQALGKIAEFIVGQTCSAREPAVSL